MATSNKIDSITADWVLDSRGNPTVEASVKLKDGSIGIASVPSGASRGQFEAHELRDGGKDFHGLGVQVAMDNIKDTIAPALKGQDALDQTAVDEKLINLDGTDNKTKLGANSMLAVSLAVSKAAAIASGQDYYRYLADLAGTEPGLPTPMCNVVNGGAHANFATEIQEFMVVPSGIMDTRTQLKAVSEIYQSLKKVVSDQGWQTTIGDEGGFVVGAQAGNRAALDAIMSAIALAGYRPGHDVFLALDVAASEFYKDGKYELETKSMTSDELVEWLVELNADYPFISIEDGLAEEDWDGWQQLTAKLGESCMLVGDDLFVTNKQRLQKGLEQKVANAVLIKPNQIGTLSETVSTMQIATEAGYECVVSHRSGDTEDTAIAHLAVGLNAGWIKSGAPARGERTAKYNELLRIASKLEQS